MENTQPFHPKAPTIYPDNDATLWLPNWISNTRVMSGGRFTLQSVDGKISTVGRLYWVCIILHGLIIYILPPTAKLITTWGSAASFFFSFSHFSPRKTQVMEYCYFPRNNLLVISLPNTKCWDYPNARPFEKKLFPFVAIEFLRTRRSTIECHGFGSPLQVVVGT